MEVDPDQLRALAASMDQVRSSVETLDIRTKATTVGQAMSASSLGDVCAEAAEHVEEAWLRMARRCQRFSNICKGNAGNYEVTDTDFRDRLSDMGGGF